MGSAWGVHCHCGSSGNDAVASCLEVMLQFDAGVACCLCLRHEHGPCTWLLGQVPGYPGLAAPARLYSVPRYLLARKLPRATSWPAP